MSRALRRQRQKALPLELAKRSIFDYAPLFRAVFFVGDKVGDRSQ